MGNSSGTAAGPTGPTGNTGPTGRTTPYNLNDRFLGILEKEAETKDQLYHFLKEESVKLFAMRVTANNNINIFSNVVPIFIEKNWLTDNLTVYTMSGRKFSIKNQYIPPPIVDPSRVYYTHDFVDALNKPDETVPSVKKQMFINFFSRLPKQFCAVLKLQTNEIFCIDHLNCSDLCIDLKQSNWFIKNFNRYHNDVNEILKIPV
jgi:hypothetical protein